MILQQAFFSSPHTHAHTLLLFLFSFLISISFFRLIFSPLSACFFSSSSHLLILISYLCLPCFLFSFIFNVPPRFLHLISSSNFFLPSSCISPIPISPFPLFILVFSCPLSHSLLPILFSIFHTIFLQPFLPIFPNLSLSSSPFLLPIFCSFLLLVLFNSFSPFSLLFSCFSFRHLFLSSQIFFFSSSRSYAASSRPFQSSPS